MLQLFIKQAIGHVLTTVGEKNIMYMYECNLFIG